jgi:very-short-patch-repair endonuclease
LQNKRSKWKNQFQQIESSSLFHEKIRNILCEDAFFAKLACYQEVPVGALVAGYADNHYVDWYIDELGLILELHGRQHYQITNFGNKGYEKAIIDFNNIRYRDNIKKQALLEAGYEYREINYKQLNRLSNDLLRDIIFQCKQE